MFLKCAKTEQDSSGYKRKKMFFQSLWAVTWFILFFYQPHITVQLKLNTHFLHAFLVSLCHYQIKLSGYCSDQYALREQSSLCACWWIRAGTDDSVSVLSSEFPRTVQSDPAGCIYLYLSGPHFLNDAFSTSTQFSVF